MSNNMEAVLQNLVTVLAHHTAVRAMGLSGGERPFPRPGEGDIDLFVYCSAVPGKEERQQMLATLPVVDHPEVGKLEGGHWGQGDRFSLAGVESWLLYFTLAEAQSELEAILDGQYLERLDSYYYPIGRCAMWKGMRVLYDPGGFLESLKHCLIEYPKELAMAMITYHLKALEDVEDLERAVRRKDILFFHFALDLALDHFLQSVFALNREYFPSRKRSEVYLQSFKVKPLDCEERLHQVVAMGGNVEMLEQSYRLWEGLVNDLDLLVRSDMAGLISYP